MLPKPSQDGMRQLQRHKTATKCSKENSLTPAKNLGEKRRENTKILLLPGTGELQSR